MTMKTDKVKKGIIGIEMLIPVFLLMFSIIIIFAGIEWSMNTLSLMAEEKQITQMDAEILGMNQLYIEPSLKFTMQEITRELALHGGLSSEILANNKLFVLKGTSNAAKSSIEQDIENDFAAGNLNFPSVDSQMKVEGNILYWSYVAGENLNIETIPYKYDYVPYIGTDLGCGACPASVTFPGSSIIMIKSLQGSLERYDWDGSNWILSETYTDLAVISTDAMVNLKVTAGSEAHIKGAHTIDSAFEPLFPKISYPGDALAQRYEFPRFTDIMMSDRLNLFRSDYGSSKTSIGSTLSLGTWNSFFIPIDENENKTISFYGGNRIVSNTGLVSMENTDHLVIELDNRYWKLFSIAETFMDNVTDVNFLAQEQTINAYYQKKYPSYDIFRENTAKTCTDEWKVVLADNTYNCSGQQKDNLHNDIDTCSPSNHIDSTLYIKEITVDSHGYDMGETINVYVDVICVPGEEFVSTIAYSFAESDWDDIKGDTITCPPLTMVSDGGYIRLSESFVMATTYSTHHIRASVGRASKGDSAGETCMDSSVADNDEITFEYIGVVVSSFYADSVKDSCFDGDMKCMFQDSCNDKYSGTPPVLEPKDTSDKFVTLKAKENGLYTSKPIRFDITDDFNYDFGQKFTGKSVVPFFYGDIDKEDLADNITAPGTDMYLTFNYGSNTTIGCGEREDVITEINVYLNDYNGYVAAFLEEINPDLKGTDSEDFFKKQKIVFDDAAKFKIAKNIEDNGYIDLKLQVKTDKYGENLPSQMYTERNERVYIFDNLINGAYPSMIMDINPLDEENIHDISIENGFAEATGIAVDKDENIYIINSDEHRLHKYNNYSIFQGYMDLPDQSPQGIDIDIPTGNIYITFKNHKNVTRYSSFFNSKDFGLNAGIPPTPFEMCNNNINNPTDVAVYENVVFVANDINSIYYCLADEVTSVSLEDVLAGHKIDAISIDSAEKKLYAKVKIPVYDAFGNLLYYGLHYHVYDLSVWATGTNNLVKASETLPIGFNFKKFDIYTPVEGGDRQAYFVRDTDPKSDTYALLDDFTLNIDFGNTLQLELESMADVEGLTDRIEYYEDGCNGVVVKDDCNLLWIQYALNEYYDKYDLYNPANCGAGATAEDAAIVKSLLGLPQSANIPCTQTIDSANINPFPGSYMEVKMKDKIIGPRIEALIRQYNDLYNSDEIYIDVDYKIQSDFGVGWNIDDFWAEEDSFSTGSVNTGVGCACRGKTTSCLSGYSGHGILKTIRRTNSWCEYKYGATYSLNITIEDKNTEVWDPILHDMTTLKFKYGFEWSDIDDTITNTYTADKRDLGAYLAGDEAYCSPAYTPDVCHVQNGIANYYDHINDPLECPGREGTGVTYNVLHCQNDDYGYCYGPTHQHCRSCGEGCTSCYSHRHKSCYNYGCVAKYNNAVTTDFNRYETCHGPQIPPPPPIPPTEDEDDEDETSIVSLNMTFNVDATTGTPNAMTDLVSFTYDISGLGSPTIDTKFTPGTPSPVSPSGCNGGYAGSLTIYVNKSYVGDLFVKSC